MGEFVGKRVVPDHVGVWDQKKTYEPLMIVLDGETGDSYISRKAVPVGISLADESYWSLCAHYSAQMRKLEQDVDVDVQQIINILPPEWEDTFGRPITSIGEINLLEQRHYAADWDVLRPAKELAEYSTLTSEDLEELLHEAEKIIEGWPIPDEHGAGESADNGDGESAGVGTECGADVGAGTEENGDRADL